MGRRSGWRLIATSPMRTRTPPGTMGTGTMGTGAMGTGAMGTGPMDTGTMGMSLGGPATVGPSSPMSPTTTSRHLLRVITITRTRLTDWAGRHGQHAHPVAKRAVQGGGMRMGR